LAKSYKKICGIEFNPIKNWAKKLIIFCYSTVDIPSGCIWNLKHIIDNIQKKSRRELSANLKNLS
jgi:hypothetical protein